MLTGCHILHRRKKHTPPPASAPAPIVEEATGTFTPPPAPAMPVKRGQLPLAYIVESGGVVRIADQETGQTIAQAVASAGGIVSVDEKAGVRVDGELIVKGPLPAGRMYEIYLENQGENVMRQQQIRPGFQPRN
jgi:hypothetical protein